MVWILKWLWKAIAGNVIWDAAKQAPWSALLGMVAAAVVTVGGGLWSLVIGLHWITILGVEILAFAFISCTTVVLVRKWSCTAVVTATQSHIEPTVTRALADLLGELESIILAMRDEQGLAALGVTPAERSQVFERNRDRLMTWTPLARTWIHKNRPDAIRIFSKCADIKDTAYPNLALAKCYRDNLDAIYTDLTGSNFTAPVNVAASAPVHISRGLSAQVRDMQQEQFDRETFPVLHGGDTTEYSRSRIDRLSEYDRVELFRPRPEIKLFWYGRPRDGSTWHRFRLPGGAGFTEEEFEAMPDARKQELFNAHYPELLDWYHPEGRANSRSTPSVGATPRPDLDYEVKISGKRVYLAVTNHGATGEFTAQVTMIQGAESNPPAYWDIKWQGTSLSRAPIIKGQTKLLELVELDAMGEFVTGGNPGRFWFLGPETRYEIWLSRATARRLGTTFLYQEDIVVTVTIASAETGLSRSIKVRIGINNDPEMSPRPTLEL